MYVCKIVELIFCQFFDYLIKLYFFHEIPIICSLLYKRLNLEAWTNFEALFFKLERGVLNETKCNCQKCRVRFQLTFWMWEKSWNTEWPLSDVIAAINNFCIKQNCSSLIVFMALGSFINDVTYFMKLLKVLLYYNFFQTFCLAASHRVKSNQPKITWKSSKGKTYNTSHPVLLLNPRFLT